MRKRLPQTLSDQEWSQLLALAVTDPGRLKGLLSPGTTNNNIVEISHKSDRLYSLGELIDFYKVDTSEYECIHQDVNYWEVAAKLKDENGKWYMEKTPLYQIKARFRRICPDNALAQIRSKLLGEIAPIGQIEKRNYVGTMALEINNSDFHFGKVGLETDWTMEAAGELWRQSIEFHLSMAPMGQVTTIILPIGNDLLHFDNTKGQTYNGTQTGLGSEYISLLKATKELVCETIQQLSVYGQVVVPFVSGNHDRESTFTLAEMVVERFRGRDDILILSQPVMRQYYRFGSVLIAWTHGDITKIKDFAGKFPLERARDFADAPFRYGRLGHLHYSQKDRYAIDPEILEYGGVEVEIIPSLCPTDKWHHDQGYVGSHRRSKAFLYDQDAGLVASYNFYKI